jgi:E3 ubiquitin-protein ligase RAD18
MELHRKSEQQSVVHEVTSSSQKSEAGTNDDAPRRRSKRRRLSRSSSDKDSPERDTQPLERGEVLCPICSKPVQEESINSHVDRCLAGEPEDDATRSKHFRSVAKPATARAPEKRLPKLNYSVLTEAKLRTELSRLNIPTQGSKATLQRRHTEWVTLWNSNLDAKNPSARRVLLRELKAWEDAQTRPNVKLTTEEVEERAADDGVAFKELIERARASALAAKRKSIEAAAEDAAAEATHPPSVKPVLDV